MTAIVLVLALVGTQRVEPMSLVDCIQQALQKNPSIQLSRVGLLEARAEKLGTRANYLPSIWLQVSDSYDFGQREALYLDGSELPVTRDASYSEDFHSLGISLRQNLFDGGAMWKRPQSAHLKEQRAQVDMTINQESVALGVVEAFFQVLGQQHALNVLQEALLLSQEQLKLAKERHRLGAASKVDVSMARLSVGEDKIALERQKLLLDQARIALNQAIGNPVDHPIRIRDEFTTSPKKVLRSTVRTDNARLQKNLLESRLAQLQVEIAQAGWWPSLVGSVSYGRQNQDFYKVYSRFDELYQVRLALSLSFPIFEGFAMQSRIEVATAQQQRVDAQKTQVQQELDAAVQNARLRLQRLKSITAIERNNVSAAQDSLALAKERYSVGDGTALEIRDAQLAVTRAKLAQVQTQYDYQLARADYHHARGDLLRVYLPKKKFPSQ